ncbi:hypothetical protein IW261DRAFT_1424470 [Armillaria novae-zelandiae]|uniref:Uncharacterized protein n=1 Tax=Armillaria novae-zelandiae TaxID=153914 RepID=A0AA39NUV2_9AGAR|nr:hypothetical protein IW261DRAFT_1424470 [Armillaria novae-zelandiae]
MFILLEISREAARRVLKIQALLIEARKWKFISLALPANSLTTANRPAISQCTTLTLLDVGFTPPRENLDKVVLFINGPNILHGLPIVTFRKTTHTLPGGSTVETALSGKNRLRVLERSVDLEADKERPCTTILTPTDREYLEELKAEGMSITVRITATGSKWEESLEFAQLCGWLMLTRRFLVC